MGRKLIASAMPTHVVEIATSKHVALKVHSSTSILIYAYGRFVSSSLLRSMFPDPAGLQKNILT